MKRPLLVVLRNMALGGAIGWAASKLLPPVVICAAALGIMVWAIFSLRQISRKQKEIQAKLDELKGRQEVYLKGPMFHKDAFTLSYPRLDQEFANDDARQLREVRELAKMAGESDGYKSYTCPKCGKVSHHPMDLKHRYCGVCHTFEN